MPRPRKRAAGLVVGAGILFFLGTNVQAGWLFVIAACLLGAVVAGMALPGRMLRGVDLDRSAPAEVHQGDEVRVELGVTNRSRGMRLGLLVDDGFVEPASVSVPALRPGERAEVTTARRARHRGPQAATSVTVRSSAPFGIAERRRVLTPAGEETLVLPAVIALGPLPFVRPAATSDHAIHAAPRRGQGPEYLGIREYRPGDPLRHVHWPSTARTGSVMVREFEQEQTRRLAIVLDAGWDAAPGEDGGPTPLDRACAAAASIALAALAEGHGARLVLPGEGSAEVLARADGGTLLRRLALVTPSGGAPFAERLAGLADELRGVETAALVFPARGGLDPAPLARAVGDLAGRLAQVVALPVEVTAGEEERRARPLDWGELEEALRRAGAQVYPWRAGDDLAAVLSPDVAPAEVGA